MFRYFLKKNLGFQIITVLIIVILIPAIALGANFITSSYSEKAVMKDSLERLNDIYDFINKSFNKKTVEVINKGDDAAINETLRDITMPLTHASYGSVIGYYIPGNSKYYVYSRFRENIPLVKQNIKFNPEKDSKLQEDIKWVINNKKANQRTYNEKRGTIVRTINPIIKDNKVIAVNWEEAVIPPEMFIMRKNMYPLFILAFGALLTGMILAFIIMKNMEKNINTVLKGLNTMESDLSCQIPEINGEIGKVANSINNMANSLREKKILEERLAKSEKLAALGQLVSGVAHEIRNPLGIMSATVQLMEKDFQENEELKEYMKVLKEQTERQSGVIQDLLDYARPTKPMFFPLSINELLKSVMSFTGHYLQEKRIKSDIKLMDKIHKSMMDGDKIKQVLVNMIVNACDAMKDGGELHIETYEENGQVCISFRDTGIGMEKEEIKNIFNPYYTTKQSGTGLGLAISNNIIEMHNGIIKVQSEKNRGSVFTICLPFADMEGENKYE